jgi:hypothetical protein
MESKQLDDIINEVINEHDVVLNNYNDIYSLFKEIIWMPKQVLINLSSVIEYMQSKDSKSTLGALEETSLILETLNKKINQSIELIKSGDVVEKK